YTSKALNSSKKLTHSLLPPVLEKFGLHAGIEELSKQLIDTENVNIEYINNVSFDFNENEKHIHVFRILQELLINSVQERKATFITITFNEVEEKKICNYSDNGLDFDILAKQNNATMINVESRILVLEGQILIQSQINNGISVVFNF
ncbi:MAG: sensor histidine kinase, partial [Flavobacterium sp.]